MPSLDRRFVHSVVRYARASGLALLAGSSWGCSGDSDTSNPPPLAVIEARDQLRADQTALMWLEAYMMNRLDQAASITHPLFVSSLSEQNPDGEGHSNLQAMKAALQLAPATMVASTVEEDRDASIVLITLQDPSGRVKDPSLRMLLSRRGDDRWWVVPPSDKEASLSGGDSGQQVEAKAVDPEAMVVPGSAAFLEPKFRE